MTSLWKFSICFPRQLSMKLGSNHDHTVLMTSLAGREPARAQHVTFEPASGSASHFLSISPGTILLHDFRSESVWFSLSGRLHRMWTRRSRDKNRLINYINEAGWVCRVSERKKKSKDLQWFPSVKHCIREDDLRGGESWMTEKFSNFSKWMLGGSENCQNFHRKTLKSSFRDRNRCKIESEVKRGTRISKTEKIDKVLPSSFLTEGKRKRRKISTWNNTRKAAEVAYNCVCVDVWCVRCIIGSTPDDKLMQAPFIGKCM